jgi:hypothetical protein
MVGQFRTDLIHGFLDVAETFTTIDFPGANQTRLESINNHGAILGDYFLPGGESHSFIYVDGIFHTLDLPDLPGVVVPLSINDAGDMVGEYANGRGVRGFLLRADGSLSTIDFPGPFNTVPRDINNAGQIVGFIDPVGLPEPGSLAIVCGGFLGLELVRRRRLRHGKALAGDR